MPHKQTILGLLLAVGIVLGRFFLWAEPNGSASSSEKKSSKDNQQEDINNLPRFLQEYISFHKAHRADTTNAKYLVWSCGDNGCGGTGDRIKGIVSAFYTAVCSQRILLIDWPTTRSTTGHSLAHYLVPNQLDWQVPPTLDLVTTGMEIGKFKRMHGYNSPVLKNLQVPLHLSNHSLLIMRTNRWYQDEMPDRHWYGGTNNSTWHASNSPCLRSLWGEDDHHHFLFRAAFQTLFRFSTPVLHHAQWIQSQIGSNSQSYVGVHIRTGDAFDDPARHASLEEYQQFWDCAQLVQQTCSDNNHNKMPIYVASDSPQVKEWIHSKSTSVVTLPNLTLYHFDQPHSATNAQSATLGQLTVWAELYVLMQAACLVTSTSGFSQLAAWLQPTSNHQCSTHFQDCQMTDKCKSARG